jgi:hypothetical protein
MRNDLLRILIAAIFLATGTASAQTPLPNPVKTCEDVRAYIGPDESMTMESFKGLLTASGADLSGGGSGALDLQCKASAYVKHDIMSQHVLTKASGGEIRLTGHLVMDNGTCKLTEISVAGC